VTELQDLLADTSKELDNARVKLDNRDIRIKELEKIIESQKGQYNLRHKTPKTTIVWNMTPLFSYNTWITLNIKMKSSVTPFRKQIDWWFLICF